MTLYFVNNYALQNMKFIIITAANAECCSKQRILLVKMPDLHHLRPEAIASKGG